MSEVTSLTLGGIKYQLNKLKNSGKIEETTLKMEGMGDYMISLLMVLDIKNTMHFNIKKIHH